MKRGAISSTGRPLARRNVASMNRPEWGRFSPLLSTLMACFMQGGFSPVLSYVGVSLSATAASSATIPSRPGIVSGTGEALIFSEMYVVSACRISRTVLSGLSITWPSSTCLFTSFHSRSWNTEECLR